MGQPIDLRDRLFCEAGNDIGLLTQENINIAVEKQNTDRAIGVNKPIGAYFVEDQILSRDQIGQILKIQNKYANVVGSLPTETPTKAKVLLESEQNPSTSIPSQESPGHNVSSQTVGVFIAVAIFALVLFGAYQSSKGGDPVVPEREKATAAAASISDSAPQKNALAGESNGSLALVGGTSVLCEDTAIVFCVNIATIYSQFIERVRSFTALDKIGLSQLLSAVPDFRRARAQANTRACFANMRVILGATEIYNMDHSEMLTDVDIPQLISGSYLKSPIIYPDPKCSYSANGDLSGTGEVVCSLHGSVYNPITPSSIESTNNERLSDERINEIRDGILAFDSTKCFRPTGFLWVSISSDMVPHIILEASIKPLDFFSFLQRLNASIPQPKKKSQDLVVIDLQSSKDSKDDFQCRIMPTGIEILPVKKELKPNIQAWADLVEAIKAPKTILALEIDGLRAQQIQWNQSTPVLSYFQRAQLYLSNSKIQIKSIPPAENNFDAEKTKVEFVISKAKSEVVTQLKTIEAPHIQFVQNLLDNIVVSKNSPWLEIRLEGLDTSPIFANRGWFDIATALALENMKQAKAMAQKRACFANMRVILGAIEMYNMDNSEMLTYVDLPRLVSGSYLKSEIKLPTPNCSYSARGDLTEDGLVCCAFHGAVEDAEQDPTSPSRQPTSTNPERSSVSTTPTAVAVTPPTALANQDHSVTKTMVEQLYAVVFKEGLSPKPESIQAILTPSLYSLLSESSQKYQASSSEDDDGPPYSFVPGNGGADGFTIKVSEVNDKVASVTVCFYFKGQAIDPNWKVSVQLEKQSNNQWLVSNIVEYYEGQVRGDMLSDLILFNKNTPSQPTSHQGALPEKQSQVVIVDGGSLKSEEKEMIFALAKALTAGEKTCPSAFVFNGLNDKEGRKVFTIQGGEVYEDHFATHAWYQIDSKTGEVFEEDMVECTLSATGVKIPIALQTGTNQMNSSPFLWVNDKDGLILRNSPARSGQKVDIMPFRSEVIVDDRSGPSETIIGITANWYKVRFKGKDGWKEGWCFSGLLTDKEPSR